MVRVNLLTYFTFMINSLVDAGYSMPMGETKKLCEEEAILKELETRFTFTKTGLDLSMLDADARKEILSIFQDMAMAVNERKKFGVEKNGLCLLIAYAQEQIQRESRK